MAKTNIMRRFLGGAVLAAVLTPLSTTALAQGMGSYVDVHDFGGTFVSNGATIVDGEQPNNIAFDSKGDIFGTTSGGGAARTNGIGTVFELTSAGVYQVLHVFGVTSTDGLDPLSPIIFDGSGDIFGTAAVGGANNGGMLWEITTSGTYKDLRDFGGTITDASGGSSKDGTFPYAAIAFDTQGDLFGACQEGGPNSSSNGAGAGMIWEITAAGVYKDLHDFGGTVTNADGTSGPDGLAPSSGVLLDTSGNIYGTAGSGGPNYVSGSLTALGGMLWELTSTGDYKDLHDFGGELTLDPSGTVLDGVGPNGVIARDSAGDLYGVNYAGGAYNGGDLWTLYVSGRYSTLHDFGGSLDDVLDGSVPGGVSIDPNGNLYGLTTQGGRYAASPSAGILWKYGQSGYTDLHDFNGTITEPSGSTEPDGRQPVGAVVSDTFGNLYGTTTQGAADGQGDLWKMVSPLEAASFSPGLTLFSLPYGYSDVELDNVFSSSGVELAVWNPEDFSYILTQGSSSNGSIAIGQGYWARFPQTTNINGPGQLAGITEPFTIHLSAGWNMVGDPFFSPSPISGLLFNKGSETFAQASSGSNPLVGSIVYCYQQGAYGASTSLEPYVGYWVFAFQSTDLTVPAPAGSG